VAKLFGDSDWAEQEFCAGGNNCNHGVHSNRAQMDISSMFQRGIVLPNTLEIPDCPNKSRLETLLRRRDECKIAWRNTIPRKKNETTGGWIQVASKQECTESLREMKKVQRECDNLWTEMKQQYADTVIKYMSLNQLYIAKGDSFVKYSDVLAAADARRLEAEKSEQLEKLRFAGEIVERDEAEKLLREEQLVQYRKRIDEAQQQRVKDQAVVAADTLSEEREEALWAQCEHKSADIVGETKKQLVRRLKAEKAAEKAAEEATEESAMPLPAKSKSKQKQKRNRTQPVRASSGSDDETETSELTNFQIPGIADIEHEEEKWKISIKKHHAKQYLLWAPSDGFVNKQTAKESARTIKKKMGCGAIVLEIDEMFVLGWATKNLSTMAQDVIEYLVAQKIVVKREQLDIYRGFQNTVFSYTETLFSIPTEKAADVRVPEQKQSTSYWMNASDSEEDEDVAFMGY